MPSIFNHLQRWHSSCQGYSPLQPKPRHTHKKETKLKTICFSYTARNEGLMSYCVSSIIFVFVCFVCPSFVLNIFSMCFTISLRSILCVRSICCFLFIFIIISVVLVIFPFLFLFSFLIPFFFFFFLPSNHFQSADMINRVICVC